MLISTFYVDLYFIGPGDSSLVSSLAVKPLNYSKLLNGEHLMACSLKQDKGSRGLYLHHFRTSYLQCGASSPVLLYYRTTFIVLQRLFSGNFSSPFGQILLACVVDNRLVKKWISVMRYLDCGGLRDLMGTISMDIQIIRGTLQFVRYYLLLGKFRT